MFLEPLSPSKWRQYNVERIMTMNLISLWLCEQHSSMVLRILIISLNLISSKEI